MYAGEDAVRVERQFDIHHHVAGLIVGDMRFAALAGPFDGALQAP